MRSYCTFHSIYLIFSFLTFFTRYLFYPSSARLASYKKCIGFYVSSFYNDKILPHKFDLCSFGARPVSCHNFVLQLLKSSAYYTLHKYTCSKCRKISTFSAETFITHIIPSIVPATNLWQNYFSSGHFPKIASIFLICNNIPL